MFLDNWTHQKLFRDKNSLMVSKIWHLLLAEVWTHNMYFNIGTDMHSLHAEIISFQLLFKYPIQKQDEITTGVVS